MSSKNIRAVERLLSNTIYIDSVKELVAPDATYVSPSLNNPSLKQIMPWYGTQNKAGPPLSSKHPSAWVGTGRLKPLTSKLSSGPEKMSKSTAPSPVDHESLTSPKAPHSRSDIHEIYGRHLWDSIGV
jgi:hypothetical protein